MSRFELHLLGSPHIVRPDGTPVDLPLGKPLAMLCFIALEPSAVGRSDLAAVLWPSSSESRAKASIRQALWLIRKHTEADLIVEAEGQLRVNPALVALDLDLLESHLAAGRLEDALALWDGGPLRAFDVPDAQPWVAWADEVRSRWEAHLGRAVEDRAAASIGTERVKWLERALEIRPYRVESWAQLVEAQVDLRDLDAAEAALARLRPVADPEDEPVVRQAEAHIRLLRRSAFGDPDRRLVPDFVGRSEEFAALMGAWRSAGSGRPRVMGIQGPPGIGKTALARELLRHCEADGAAAVQVRAIRSEVRVDLGVLASVAADLVRRPGAAGTSPASARILKGLVPSEAVETPPPSPGPAVVADAVADLMAAVSHEQPIVVLVDDAQWMDESSAVVLLRAMRHLSDAPVLMLWTARTNGPARAAVRALDDAAEAGTAGRLTLAPLSRAHVEEMVALLLEDTEPERVERLAGAVHEASGGVPLHAVELLRSLRDHGHLEATEHGWRLASDTDLGRLAGSLPATQRQRIRPLTGPARAIGRALSHAPAPLPRPELCRRADLSDPECDAALAELLDRNLIQWTGDDRLELAHDSLAEAFRTADEVEVPGVDDGSPWGVTRGWMAAAAVVVLLLLGITAVRAGRADAEGPQADSPPPFGGGSIWIGSWNFWVGYELTGDPSLRAVDSVPLPENLSIRPVALDANGRPIVAGFTNNSDVDAPDAVLLREDRLDTLFSSPGDDVLRTVRPQLDAGLLAVQHPDTSRFRMMTVRIGLDPSRAGVGPSPRPDRPDTALLAAGDVSYTPFYWSSDGRQIVVHADGMVDSLIVMDPGGRRLHALASPDRSLHDAVPCGPNRVLAASVPDGSAARRWFWTFGDARVEPWVPSSSTAGVPVCSPDGSAVAYLAKVGDRTTLVIEDLDGRILLREPIEGTTWLRWFPPPSPAPVRVTLPLDTLWLDRGQRDTVHARVLDQDSLDVDRTVVWSSDAPALASVDELGIVAANRPGTAVVRARVDGWLEDSLVVVVREVADVPRLAFADSFAVFDAGVWVVAGEPPPVPMRLPDGEPVLELRGDGNYSDRIDTVEEFDLGLGATLEARFRMASLQRRDRQRMMICLVDGDGRGDGEVRRRQQQCLQWPAGEGLDFRPDAVRFTQAGIVIGDIPIGDLARPGEWTTLALQVQADGWVEAVVNDSIVAVHPSRLQVRSDDRDIRFHISIAHAAKDTELLLRDVLLWTEPRYH